MKKSLIALAFGTLALGMSEFVMMGILPYIARSLGISIPEAGHLISAYALGVCFGAPLMVLVARKLPLKRILLALTALIIFGNLCAALAPNYWTLLLMRFVSGLPHGAFFGVGSIVAERVAGIFGFGGQTQAVEGDEAGCHVDDALHGIGQDTDRRGQEEGQEFARHQDCRDDDHSGLDPLFDGFRIHVVRRVATRRGQR